MLQSLDKDFNQIRLQFMPKLILFNKPYGVLSQFRDDDNNNFATLSNYLTDKSLRVAGRLDAISEGLLLLTDNGQVNQALTAPPKVIQKKNLGEKQGKTYWVQLEGNASDAQIQQLQNGVLLKDGLTLPALVERLDIETVEHTLWQAPDNIAKRKITTWLAITIFEGKNRQVRRMTAHVGLPCLRLVRMASSGFKLGELKVGEWREVRLAKEDLERLGIDLAKASTTQTQAKIKRPFYSKNLTKPSSKPTRPAQHKSNKKP